ncbi:MAG: DNA-3-methyladenine glycosylase I [Phycisphaeraceae bacterium]|nr:DNA-3-methyladenine glycosylase I [Phycisphaeraceae bacterium]
MSRCAWAKNELAIGYHDREWGVPSRDDRTLFEFLILEGAQAGLSWDTILKKRARYREVFEGFEAERVARFTPARVEKLMGDAGIVRHRGKIESAVTNARAFLEVREEFGSFAAFVWGFTEVGGRAKAGEPIVNRVRSIREVPARTAESDAMSRALKKRGFKFVGSTICYAYMQAVGMVNDHEVTCPRWRAVQKSAR